MTHLPVETKQNQSKCRQTTAKGCEGVNIMLICSSNVEIIPLIFAFLAGTMNLWVGLLLHLDYLVWWCLSNMTGDLWHSRALIVTPRVSTYCFSKFHKFTWVGQGRAGVVIACQSNTCIVCRHEEIFASFPIVAASIVRRKIKRASS